MFVVTMCVMRQKRGRKEHRGRVDRQRRQGNGGSHWDGAMGVWEEGIEGKVEGGWVPNRN